MAVETQPVSDGTYATQPGWGELQIVDKDGVRRFHVSAVGANAHVCEAEGRIDGNVGRTDEAGRNDDGAEQVCVIDIDARPERLTLTYRTETACRHFCGMRAQFSGEYVRLPTQCTPAARDQRNAARLQTYKAKRYADALAAMDVLDGECGAFFNWIEKDSFANDKAITLFHLGRKTDCLDVLKDTLVGDADNEAVLRETASLPPTDWDSYLPVAKATWHNRKLCSGLKQQAK